MHSPHPEKEPDTTREETIYPREIMLTTSNQNPVAARAFLRLCYPRARHCVVVVVVVS